MPGGAGGASIGGIPGGAGGASIGGIGGIGGISGIGGFSSVISIPPRINTMRQFAHCCIAHNRYAQRFKLK